MVDKMSELESIDVLDMLRLRKMDSGAPLYSKLSLKKGEYIFKQEDPSDKLFYIVDGGVKIGVDGDSEKSVTKAIFTTGEIFGEKALVGEVVRRNFAMALKNTEVFVIKRSQMSALIEEDKSFSIYMMKLIGSRAVKMEKRLESIIFKDSRSRIIEFIIDLTKDRGQRVGYEWVVRNFITHQEIAYLTATSRQTVTTLLNELKAKNLVTFNRKRLLIRNLEGIMSEL